MRRGFFNHSKLFILGALGVLAGPAQAQSTHQPASADSARILKARNAMRPLGREARLGPWRLLTDVAAGELAALDGVAANLAEGYGLRYGLGAAAGPGQTIVIYSSDVRYRAFIESDSSPSFAARGHAGGGIAAFATGRTPLETRVLLVHELTHLLSQGVFGDSIPAWLDEGLAEDLAWCKVDAEGRLQPDTFDVLGSPKAGAPGSLEWSGPRVTADAWIQSARAGRLPPLAALLSPATRLFADVGARRDATATSAMLVRWCLADADRSVRFRSFLKSVAKGGAGDAAALAAALGMDAPAIQNELFAWARLAHSGP